MAALKLAWQSLLAAKHPGHHLVFFGARRDALMTLRAEGAWLTSDAPDVQAQLRMTLRSEDPRLDIRSVDAVVLHGLYDPNSLNIRAGLLDRHVQQHGFASSSLIEAFADMWLEESIWHHVGPVVRTSTTVPVFVTPQPLISAGVIDGSARYRGAKFIPYAQGYQGRILIESGISARDRLAARLEQIVIDQPRETIDRHWYTSSEYSEGSVRLSEQMDVQHSRAEAAHMNPFYGELVLRDLFDQLAASSGLRGEGGIGLQ